MARDRQRAKQRQAARRAARLERNGDPEASRPGRDRPDGAIADGEPVDYDLAAGAPPEETGRSDTIFGFEQHQPDGIPDAEELDDAEAAELGREAQRESLEAPIDPARRDRSDADRGEAGLGSKIVTFLKGCWAELQRVQWPGRTQLFTLTGVVLGFVVIAGGYLGLLDFVFYRLIRAILF